MRIKEEFDLGNLESACSIARSHPFATIVTADLRATHMPCLVDEEAEGLTILGHVALADPASAALAGPVLLIFQGPHGYVSASWYESDTIPTWNHVTLHVSGTPELLDDALPLLRRTVDHFEAAVEQPWSLDRMGETAREMADQVVAFRLEAVSWHAEAKLSQDKPAEEQERVLAGLEAPGPYANAWLAAAMRSGHLAGRPWPTRLGQTIPALPVRDVAAAAAFYRDRLGFGVTYQVGGFAIVRRDDAVIHLWQADDESWRRRTAGAKPICSGAESFIAGTASCRIAVEGVDPLFEELSRAGVLHPVSRDGVANTDHGTREISALDCDGNLLTFFE